MPQSLMYLSSPHGPESIVLPRQQSRRKETEPGDTQGYLSRGKSLPLPGSILYEKCQVRLFLGNGKPFS